MKSLFIMVLISFALIGCYSTAQQKAKFEEPEREQCYRVCLVSYKGNAESAFEKCFRIASKYQEGRSCFGWHGL